MPIALRAQQQVQSIKPASPGATQQAPPTTKLHDVHELKQLEGKSCFDVHPGEVLGDLVPIDDVTIDEHFRFRRAWETILAPTSYPRAMTDVEWRKYVWSKVEWAPRPPKSKLPSPPELDEIAAKWEVDGIRYEAKGRIFPWLSIAVTIELRGNDRVSVKDAVQEEKFVLDDFDKSGLLRVLTKKFNFPYDSPDDFVIRSNPSPKWPGRHLTIGSSLPRPKDARTEWWEDVGLGIYEGEPQKLSIGVAFPK